MFEGIDILMPIIIDFDDYPLISNINWYRTGHYVSHKELHNGQLEVTYLHQYIMNHSFENNISIDHINRIPQDNRKINLRLATQTQQNWNQKKRIRTVKLPDDCNIDPNDIPTNVEYHPEYGNFGAYFEIVIKFNGEKVFRKKTTKSKKFTLEQKLTEAKIVLRDLMKEHPEWFENRCMNGQLTDDGNQLYESYFKILEMAGVTDPINHYQSIEDRNKDPLQIGDENNTSRKHVANMPPKETNITKLPDNCRYISPSATRGDYFEYDKKMGDKRVTFRSTTSKDTSTTDKYAEILAILEREHLI